jgi:DASH complex subunit DAD2
MSYAPRPTGNYPTIHTNTTSTSSSLLRHPPSTSTSGSLSTSNTQSQNHLQSRIASKRAELENLRQLRDLSANLAAQLGALEAKLATLRDGTQSVALVLANWDNVLRAIGMAAGMYRRTNKRLAASSPMAICWIEQVVAKLVCT